MSHLAYLRPLVGHRRAIVALLIGSAFILASCGRSTSTPGAGATKTPAVGHTWRLILSPNPPNPAPDQPLGSMLFGVSATSPSDVWAVGASMVDDHGPQNLIEHWNGTYWSIVPSPAHGALSSVAAVSPSDAWAVGGLYTASIFDSLPEKTQIMRWNGSQWNGVASVNPGAKNNGLSSVVAVAANDVWAVGSFSGADGVERPLIEHWDGIAWRVVASPTPPGPGRSGLSAITRIPGSNQLWAFGTTSMTNDPNVTDDRVLVERWDGSAWNLVSAPTLPQATQGCMVQGAVAVSATDAWMVGQYSAASDQPGRPLIARWNGTSWQLVSGASVNGTLWSVAANGSGDVRAVGGAVNSQLRQATLIEEWGGKVWKTATSPYPISTPTGEVFLMGIASDGVGGFWAVGTARDDTGPGGVFQTVVMRWP